MPRHLDHHALPRLTLVLGGARSGKSSFAESVVLESGFEPVYLATAEPLDEEMAVRIGEHRARRGRNWRTVEEPLDLVGALVRECGPERAVLVDCLTLWLSNLMTDGRDVAAEGARLVDALNSLRGALVLVSNEVGQGVVPDNPMARAFVDHAGRLHQALAARADAVVLLIAGLPQRLK
jgi:adenosylcobinamide kinase / adenosylcobinamide-phosphate guanylyltransferase